MSLLCRLRTAVLAIFTSRKASKRRTDSLRVLLASPVPPPDHGGIANWTRIIRNEFENQLVVNLSLLDTSVRWRAAVNQSLFIRLVGGSAQAFRDAFYAISQFYRGTVDVFHLCSSGGLAAAKDLLILSAARASRTPSLIHYRMGRIPNVVTRGGWEWKLMRAGMLIADRVIVLDRASENCLREAVPQANVVRVPNLVAIQEIDRVREQVQTAMRPDGLIRIVYVGQVLPTKGIWELVSACRVLENNRSLNLELVGPVAAGFQEELRRQASTGDNSRWLKFYGSVEHDDAIRYLVASDIFVLPSYTEGFPNVVLEAMACQCPIVATTVGAIPEMLDLGGADECGMGVPPQEIKALTEALEQLITDSSIRKELGLKARQRVLKRYAAPVVSKTLVDLWCEVHRTSQGKRWFT